jgi:membrane dipeptidase
MDLERKLKQVDKLSDDDVEREMRRWKRKNPYPRGTIHDLLDHIDHIAKVAGVEHVGLGSDYDGVSVLPAQLEDASSYPYITQGLLDRGYSEEEIRGILGGNLIRVFKKADAVAGK